MTLACKRHCNGCCDKCVSCWGLRVINGSPDVPARVAPPLIGIAASVARVITSARSTVIAAEVVVSVMYYEEPELLPTESLTPAPPCISYYKQSKLNRLVYDDSRQLEWCNQQ